MATITKRTWKRADGTAGVGFRVFYTDPQGAPAFKQFPTKREADAFGKTITVQVATQTFIDPRNAPTVSELAAEWIAACEVRQKAGRQMERGTLRNYTGIVKNWVDHESYGLGRLKITAVTTGTIARFRDAMLADQDATEDRTKRTLKVLKAIFAYAMETRDLPRNPAAGVVVKRAGRKRKTTDFPSKADLHRLIEAADPLFRPKVIIAAMTGLRAGELRGLTWDNVDLDRGFIHVRQRADSWSVMGDPKSEAGERAVPLSKFVVNTLKDWRQHCPKSDLQLVFPRADGTVLTPNLLSKPFYKLKAALKLKFRWHDLRHAAISMWIETGYAPKQVSTYAGHANIAITMDRYGHLWPSADDHAGMDRAADAFLAAKPSA